MSEDDRAAKAARAKALLKKRQAAKKDKPSGSGTGTGVASPVSERAFSPAPPEDSKTTRDLNNIFSKEDTSGDTSWLSGLTQVESTPLPATSAATSSPPSSSHPPNGHSSVDSSNVEIESLRAENEGLKSKLGEIDGLRAEKEALGSKMGEVDSLKSQNENLRVELDNVKRSEAAVKAEFRTQTETLKKRVGELEITIRSSQSEKAEVERKLESAKSELSSVQSLLEEERSHSNQLRGEIEHIQLEKENAIKNEQRTIALLVSEKATLTSELERLGEVDLRAQKIEEEFTEEQAKVRDLEQQVETLRAHVQETSTRNQQLQTKEKELTEKSREQERLLQIANNSVASLRKESESYQRRVKELEEQIESDDRAEKLEASLKNTQDHADELEFQLSKLKQTHAYLKKERDSLEPLLKTHRDGEEEWKTKHSDLQSQHQSLQQQLTAVTTEKEALLQEKTELQNESGKAQGALSLLQAKLKQAAEELAASTRQLKTAQIEAKNATRRAEEAERIQQDLQTEGMNLMRSLDEMRPKIVELTGEKLEMSEKVEALQREVNSRDAIISQLEVSLEELRDEKERSENQWQGILAERERDRTNAQDNSNELQKAYEKIQEELDAALASMRSLEADRAKIHQEASQHLKEVGRLTALNLTQAEELSALRKEVEQRSTDQAEEEDFLERAQNEIETLQQELAAKDEELQRLKDAASRPLSAGPRSLDDEMLGSYKQQHELELSTAQSHIRSLETALFDAEARSHSLIKQVAALEDQLAGHSHAPHRASPGIPSRPSSRHSTDLHRAAVQRTSSRSNLATAPPIIKRTPAAYEQSLSPETRHKRKVSLSMLRARIDSELAAAASGSNSRSLSPVPSVGSSNEGSLALRSTPANVLGLNAGLQPHLRTRPQFLDDSHVFWCSSCRGDLVIL
ncbi:hypothetical protein Moror_7210 [Moniliophthora roreri MCA 2997]|uniref:Uncharacterized protein n=1 Tax=Moniliophthora roreri (strain MCA 2997) TaxID=1381753 RepID=V2XUM2_MONRO|nr:hypothetical protein Moror_7210 [Moniliophthora roreri MCA 2997]